MVLPGVLGKHSHKVNWVIGLFVYTDTYTMVSLFSLTMTMYSNIQLNAGVCVCYCCRGNPAVSPLLTTKRERERIYRTIDKKKSRDLTITSVIVFPIKFIPSSTRSQLHTMNYTAAKKCNHVAAWSWASFACDYDDRGFWQPWWSNVTPSAVAAAMIVLRIYLSKYLVFASIASVTATV